MNEKKKQDSENNSMSKADVKAYLDEIEQKVSGSSDAYLHALIAINEILRLPNAQEVLDEKLKGRLRDLWLKLRSTGIQLENPPFLFGLPQDFGKESLDQEILAE